MTENQSGEKNGKQGYRGDRSGVVLTDILFLLVGEKVDQSGPGRLKIGRKFVMHRLISRDRTK